MSDYIRGSHPPAPRSMYEVIRITTAEASLYACFSKSIWGQYVHWYGRRTHECVQDKKIECEGCKHGWPVKWKGYMHVSRNGKNPNTFLEITDTAFRLIDHQIGDQKNLRGIMFRGSRTKGGPKGRYIIDLLERRLPESEMPQEADPYPTLKYLWSCKRPALYAD